MVVLFIIVGLIYDWGGVVGHPGPVRSLFCFRCAEQCLSGANADHALLLLSCDVGLATLSIHGHITTTHRICPPFNRTSLNALQHYAETLH